jgi:hypothetical protein
MYGRYNEPYFCTYFQGETGGFGPDVVASLGGSALIYQPKTFIL